jgi:hypothetical protein
LKWLTGFVAVRVLLLPFLPCLVPVKRQDQYIDTFFVEKNGRVVRMEIANNNFYRVLRPALDANPGAGGFDRRISCSAETTAADGCRFYLFCFQNQHRVFYQHKMPYIPIARFRATV